jgi:acyl-CoA thioesterase I
MFRRSFLLILALLAAHGASTSWGAERTIVVVGDSLSSGYGLAAAPSWVSLLEDRLRSEGYGYELVNASIAGDTSAGGLTRLPRLLERYTPALVIIELGGNDGLRGQPTATLEGNLSTMLELARAAGADVLLLGIRLPPNYGESYTRAMQAVYADLSAKYKAPLVDFLMDGVALDARLMQHDGIHPNAAGQPVMLENVWKVLVGLITR